MGLSSIKTLSLAYIHPSTCGRGADIPAMRGWAVYYYDGVWRCLYTDKQNSVPRFIVL